ncbi:MAG: LysM peptidoglycan-binding domain-containing protein [Chloroflexi bacterium]|nr:LysM peptidoglycan-binding domain-containing protein [Chloroflexota bacterium]
MLQKKVSIPPQTSLAVVLLALSLCLSACYKNAGENVSPTLGSGNQVNVDEIPTDTPTNPTPAPQSSPRGPVSSGQASNPDQSSTDLPSNGQPDPIDPVEANTITDPDDEQSSATPTTQSIIQPAPGGLAATPSLPPVVPIAPDDASPLEPTPTTPSEFTEETSPCVYVVQSGDTLYGIARTMVDEVDVPAYANQLSELNGIYDEYSLQAGQELRLPGCEDPDAPEVEDVDTDDTDPGPATTLESPIDIQTGDKIQYEVQPGDTLFGIAAQYPGVEVDDIMEANGLSSDTIQAGQILQIPPPAQQ